MSSEIRLATSNAAFWSELLPMGDAFIRAQNARPRTFGHPVMALSPADQRAVVNEAAFLLFEKSVHGEAIDELTAENIAETLNLAFDQNERFPTATRPSKALTLSLGKYEARAIAQNLSAYFFGRSPRLHPRLRGCGLLGEVEADVLCGGTLYEVKAGERQFRLTDLRQLLIYCALNFSSKQYEITEIALINPRSGTLIHESLEDICRKISGTSAVRVLSDLIMFVSEPVLGYSR